MIVSRLSSVSQKSNRMENLEESLDSDGFDIDWFLGIMGSDQQHTQCKNGVQELGDLSCGGFCLEDLCGGDLCFYDSGFDCLDLVEKNAVNNIGTREFGIGVQDLDGCDTDFDIDWLVSCLDSDREEKLLEKRTYEDDEFGEGFCCDALGNPVKKSGIGVQELDEFGGVSCSDEFNVDWFVRCLDSNQQEEPSENSTTKKLEKRKFGGGLCREDLGGENLCFNDSGNFDVDWFLQCLNSNQEDEEEELVTEGTTKKLEKGKYEDECGGGDSEVDWIMQLSDCNLEVEVGQHSTLRKRKLFGGEENSGLTKKTRV